MFVIGKEVAKLTTVECRDISTRIPYFGSTYLT